MIRAVLYLIASVLIISVLRAVIGAVMKLFAELFGPSKPASPGPEPRMQPRPSVTTGGDLKKDPVCGTFIATNTSLQKKVGGETYYFCSPECRDLFKS